MAKEHADLNETVGPAFLKSGKPGAGEIVRVIQKPVFDLKYRQSFPTADRLTLKDEVIIDRWSLIIENAQGNTGPVFKGTLGYLQLANPPGVRMQRVRVRPGWLKGLLGVERDYLMVTSETLGDYRMYIGARDYGNSLDVSWYLTCEPGQLKKALSEILTRGASDTALSVNLDLFEQQDLHAYATIVHRCLLKAVEKLMTALHQDFSKTDRKSKGFLGIS